ncbi:hypothetical protein [Caballeronia sp. LZ035]|uniref:hypothetical protein n=1 Tax=Caballeronia sp. LZ035 TaxID=3038568 RepID=UPI0028627EA9|nr:hypothetical protein [Caballeronia sp. LZ035]MDR5763208.1 hypothetical protein [Caballeronia sp. LZ035]
MEEEHRSAKQIQQAINERLTSAGLGPKYRVGLPSRLASPLPDGHNWHFIDVLTGDVEEMNTVSAILSEARRRYILTDD